MPTAQKSRERPKASAKKPPAEKEASASKASTRKTRAKKTLRVGVLKNTARAMRELRKFQKQLKSSLLLPKAPFQRLCREIIEDISGRNDYRFQEFAILTLQEATETYLTTMFECLQLAAVHAKRVTVMKEDIDFVKSLLLAAE
ncbi:histone-fold-containing protein [Colletotrichum somersetense]|nr:histone-fold-containing protein [Colletotrichum somersetense]